MPSSKISRSPQRPGIYRHLLCSLSRHLAAVQSLRAKAHGVCRHSARGAPLCWTSDFPYQCIEVEGAAAVGLQEQGWAWLAEAITWLSLPASAAKPHQPNRYVFRSCRHPWYGGTLQAAFRSRVPALLRARQVLLLRRERPRQTPVLANPTTRVVFDKLLSIRSIGNNSPPENIFLRPTFSSAYRTNFLYYHTKYGFWIWFFSSLVFKYCGFNWNRIKKSSISLYDMDPYSYGTW
jgi:hypothetical protein